MTGDVRRVLDDARAVFTRLDEDVTHHLEQSWRGQAGRQALEALRQYISEALDGLDHCRSLTDALVVLSESAANVRAAVDEISAPPTSPGTSAPVMPVLGLPSPASTAPAGFGGVGEDSWRPTPSLPALHRNAFDDYGVSAPTHAATTPAAPMRPVRDVENPLPAASFNTATMATPPPPAQTQLTSGAQPRGGIPYAPLMGAAYPGAIARDDGGTRRTPGYLISIDNGNELIGPLPKVAPPVLGDW